MIQLVLKFIKLYFTLLGLAYLIDYEMDNDFDLPHRLYFFEGSKLETFIKKIIHILTK